MNRAPYRAGADTDWDAVLSLIRAEFAYMAGRIDPPSSLIHLTEAGVAEQAQSGEVWLIGTAPAACVFLSARPPVLYIGKLAVAAPMRRRGLALALMAAADTRARALGLLVLQLQTRIELVENHATFRAMGFHQTAATAHPGFDHPTSLTFERRVPT